jgi:hypothetical protein
MMHSPLSETPADPPDEHLVSLGACSLKQASRRIKRGYVTGSAEGPGAQGQNRTADTRIFSPLLYRLSYLCDAPLVRIPGLG